MENKSAPAHENGMKLKATEGNSYPLFNQENLREGEIRSMRLAALNTLEHRQKESGNKTYIILDKDLWQFDAVVKSSDMDTHDSLSGKWIDFKEDLTYDYGLYQDKHGSGKYIYDLDKAIMLLVDDSDGIKPQEFDVKLRNDMMVLVGQYVYQDNNLQCKLTRLDTIPVKK
ncbi:MAG: hypothetical protein H7X99_11450 [Saprospiraceae bacterium]|nr:hypothetical protein [Saprospiraceae bacterium]